jgi:ribonuclease-3
MTTRIAAIAELERRIGHSFSDRDLLERALTHASVGDRVAGARNNERLEFLGDRVLNLIVAEELMRRMPQTTEGDLTKAFHQLVNVEACAEAAQRVGLGEALRIGGGGSKLGMRGNVRIVGDACEALIAALYVEAGLETTRACVLAMWAENFAALDGAGGRDPKTVLNEWAMARGAAPPVYRVLAQSGPAHAPTFRIEVSVSGVEPQVAEAGSKRDAEKAAAQRMLDRQEGPSL